MDFYFISHHSMRDVIYKEFEKKKEKYKEKKNKMFRKRDRKNKEKKKMVIMTEEF